MKRIASIGLAFIFLIYLLGIQFVYWAELSQVKQNSARLIQGGALEKNAKAVFYFSSAEFNSLIWTEGKKEFTLNEHHFDVVNIDYLQGKVKVTCYSDDKENHLVNAFSDLIGKFIASHAPSKNAKNTLTVQKDYLPQDCNDFNMRPLIYAHTGLNRHRQFGLPRTFISDSWNPPRIA
jgi:hypothetical protein